MDAKTPRSRLAIPAALFGLTMYVISVFAHAYGGTLFAKLFGWGKAHEIPIEKWLLRIAVAIALTFVALFIARVRRAPRDVLGEIALRTVVWFLFVLGLERYTLYIQSELVHFVQYGFVAFMLSPLLGPRKAFVAATLCGVLDEVHQYFAYAGAGDDPDNYLDWPDMMLNIGGAAGGALPFYALNLVRRAEHERAFAPIATDGTADGATPGAPAPEPRATPLALGVAVVIAVFILFIAPHVYFGHYPYDFWREYPDNFKPHHVLPTREGIPAIAGFMLFFVFLLDERRRNFPTAGLVAGGLLFHVAAVPAGTRGPLPDPDPPPWGSVPTIVCPRVTTPIKVDGVLDEPAWAKAGKMELKDAVDPEVRERWETKEHRGPQQPTTARVLWDDKNLYLAFEVADRDIWARDVPRDATGIPGDEVVELFLDCDGACTTYYELELTPRNTVFDLLVQRPPPPAWRPLPQGFVGHENWDWRGMESAVKLDGELDLLPGFQPVGPSTRSLPPSKGWVAELKLPFAALKGRRHKDGTVAEGDAPPLPGDRWRFNVTRVERPRQVTAENYQYPELSSWAPLGSKDSAGFVSFHRPWRFGFIEFSSDVADK